MSLVTIQNFVAFAQLIALSAPFLLAAFYMFRKRKLPRFIVYVFFSFILETFFMATPMLAFDFYLGGIVEAMDRDSNGINTSDEAATYTLREMKAYKMHIIDGGRNVFALLSPYLALVYTFLVGALVYGSSNLWRRINA